MKNNQVILIVDDQSENRQALGEMLEQQGYEVMVAINGAEALKSVGHAQKPDLILLDIMLPDMDGYELCRRFKTDPDLKRVPVIFISALTKSSEIIRAFEQGGVDYIPKPFQVVEVLARVKTHLQLTQLEALRLEIDERKKIEETLRENMERLRIILQTAMDGFWLTDKGGRLMEVNETYCRMSGYSRAELLTMRVQDLEVLESPEETAFHLQKVISAGEDRFESQHRRKDGSIFDVEISVQYQPGVTAPMVIFLRDITARKKADAQLQNMHKLESIGTLAGGIAHDFNNIMMGLFGNIALAKNELPKGHAGYEPLVNAEQSMARAIRLTTQLLTFAKGGKPVKETVSLGALVKEVAQFDLSGSNVLLVYQEADDLWLAKVDRGQIQQVISNLTINACQAMPNGGNLYINLENEDLPQGAIPNLQPGKYIKITFRDEGTGIEPKCINRIFEPYFTTKQTGSGLGLAIAYSIITKHSGHIDVTSEVGIGTIFTVYLPASETQVLPATSPSTEAVSASKHPAKILVMDDEELIRIVIPRWLKKWGCLVETAEDGRQVIEKYKKAREAGEPFDMMILDLTIPGGMGGVEALKAILAFDPNAKAVASSGYAEGSVMSNFAYYGFKGMIAKPFTEQQLDEVLVKVAG